MLLPSALSCESTSSPLTRYQTSLFASPPLSPTTTTSSSHPAITNIYSTCRALQSMLTPSQPPSHLPSPPTTHAEPFKLRLRNRNEPAASPAIPRKKIVKRPQPVPRGVNKRRRAIDDEGMPGENESENEENNTGMQSPFRGDDEPVLPSTPKRLRISPEVLPLGLERSDFHALNLQNKLSSSQSQSLDSQPSTTSNSNGAEEWTTDEDRMLVELVLEKLKLSRSEWQECARSLGKDRASVGRRWKSLMSAGDVGIKRKAARGRINATWR